MICTDRAPVSLYTAFYVLTALGVVLGPGKAVSAQLGPVLVASERTPSACLALEAAVTEIEPVQLAQNGVPGMWFPMPTARLILCEVRELRVRRQELALADQELALWGRQTALYAEQTALAVEARTALLAMVQGAERRATQAERRGWFRHPVLWFVLGAAVTGVAAGLIAR